MITQEFFEHLPDFNVFYKRIQALYNEGKTTGSNQSETYLQYTQLTLARLKRGLKTLTPSEEIINVASSSTKKHWLVITEAWCGDAGNILPYIVNLSKEIPDVSLKIMLRDEHPEIMDMFLTNGSRSIPIFVAMNDQFEYKSYWGPRPQPAQKMALDHKSNPNEDYQDFQIRLQKWYLNDRAGTLEQELLAYLAL